MQRVLATELEHVQVDLSGAMKNFMSTKDRHFNCLNSDSSKLHWETQQTPSDVARSKMDNSARDYSLRGRMNHRQGQAMAPMMAVGPSQPVCPQFSLSFLGNQLL